MDFRGIIYNNRALLFYEKSVSGMDIVLNDDLSGFDSRLSTNAYINRI